MGSSVRPQRAFRGAFHALARVLAACALHAALLLTACESKDPATQVFVVLNADAASRAAIRSVHLEVRRKPDAAADDSDVTTWEQRYEGTFRPGSEDPNWPLEFRLTPIGGKIDGRYLVVATASDANAQVVAQARAISGFVQGLTLGLPMIFDAACLGKAELCNATQTCRATADGTARCIDAYVNAIDLPEFRGSVTLLDDFDDPITESPAGDGGSDGSVEPPVDPCEGRDGTSFCVEDTIRACAVATGATDTPCNPGDSCVEHDGAALCVCAIGAVATTDCEVAEPCDGDNGGCDSLTTCAMIADEPACSACPTGFLGNGTDGCAPTILGVSLAAGELLTPIAPETTRLEARISVFERRAVLTWDLPEQVALEINGVNIDLNEPWTSNVLVQGENLFDVRISAPDHPEVALELLIRRDLIQDAYIKAYPPVREDGLGRGLSLEGNQLVVGVPFEDRNAIGSTSSRSINDSGSAYLFERGMGTAGVWQQSAYLKADEPQPDSWFGTTTILRGDTAIISAIQANLGGAAYVFERSGATWSQTQMFEADSPVIGSWLGLNMALQDETLFVAAPLTGTGRVYVFERGASGFTQQDALVPSGGVIDGNFGCAIALSNNTLAIAASNDGGLYAGSAYVFEREPGGSQWTESQRLVAATTADGDEFGYGIDVRGDLIVVGAPYNDTRGFDSGAAYVFARVGGEWVEQAMLVASNGGTFYAFGGSAKFLADDLLAIGSGGEGSSLSTTEPDDSNANALGAGALYLFGRVGDDWVQEAYIKAAVPGEGDAFGAPLSFSNGTLAVGAFTESGGSSGINGDQESNTETSSGAVYVFR